MIATIYLINGIKLSGGEIMGFTQELGKYGCPSNMMIYEDSQGLQYIRWESIATVVPL